MSKIQQFQKIYPLSPMQQRMLLHYLKDKDSSVSFEQDEMHLTGDLSIELFEKSFNQLLQRYDILRTNFVYQKIKEPRQVVFKEKVAAIHYEDISQLAEEEKLSYIEQFKAADRKKGFDLTKDILMRVAILRIDAEAYKVIWSYHHIIMDGWCLGIIFQDFVQIYQSLKDGKPANLSKIVPYSNYIEWLEKQDLEEAQGFWKKYLAGYTEEALPPGYHKGLKESDYSRKVRFIEFDSDIMGGLESIAERCNVTVNTVFQAVWGLLLQRYNNTADVVFGAVVSGRPAEVEGIEQMVGLFINTIPVRVKCTGELTFLNLLRKLQEDLLAASKYEFFPLAEIQFFTSVRGELINNIVIFENYPLDKQVINATGQDIGFSVKNTDNFSQTRYDLNIFVIPGEIFQLKLNYNACVFDAARIDRLEIHLQKVLKAIIQNPDICVQEMEILTTEEQSEVIATLEQLKQEKDLRNRSDLAYTAPVSPVEQKLAHIWQEVLGVTGVGVDHNFFQIGGNSINVVQVVKLINERFDVELSIGQFFLTPTIAELVNNLQNTDPIHQLECAVRLNKECSNKPNVFVIHGGSGSAYLYKDLARLLQGECNFYAMQAKGFFDPTQMAGSVDEMVIDYLHDLKAIQPAGPYIIGGYCWGARLTYELVRRLEEQGDVVEKVIAIDEYAFMPKNLAKILKLKEQGAKPVKAVQKFFNITPAPSYIHSAAQASSRKENLLPRTMEDNIYYVCRKDNLNRGIIKAPVYVIKAEEHQDERFAPKLWEEMTYASVTFYHIPGNHFNLFTSPYVENLAAAVQKVLAK